MRTTISCVLLGLAALSYVQSAEVGGEEKASYQDKREFVENPTIIDPILEADATMGPTDEDFMNLNVEKAKLNYGHSSCTGHGSCTGYNCGYGPNSCRGYRSCTGHQCGYGPSSCSGRYSCSGYNSGKGYNSCTGYNSCRGRNSGYCHNSCSAPGSCSRDNSCH